MKTNAARILDRLGIAYELRTYEVDPDDLVLECPKHGSGFHLETGEPSSLPATRPVPVYDVVVSDGDVSVVIPEAQS